MNNKILGLALATAFTAGTAQAGTTTVMDSFGTQGSVTDVNMGTLNQTLTATAFDNSLGTLTGVNVTVFAQLDSEGSSQNTSAANGRTDVEILITEAWQVTSSAADTHTFAPASFTALLDANSGAGFTMAQNDIFNYDESTGELSALLTGVNLAAFSSDVDFDFGGKAQTNLNNSVDSGTGTFSNTFSTASWGKISVEYTYDDPVVVDVPEPTTLALMGLGLGLIGFSRKK